MKIEAPGATYRRQKGTGANIVTISIDLVSGLSGSKPLKLYKIGVSCFGSIAIYVGFSHKVGIIKSFGPEPRGNNDDVVKLHSCEPQVLDCLDVHKMATDFSSSERFKYFPRRRRSMLRVRHMDKTLIQKGFCQLKPTEEGSSQVHQETPKHPRTHATRKRSKRKAIESDDLEESYRPSVFRRRRGNRSNSMNENEKLDSREVFSYLENLWFSFPEEKKKSFTYLDPLWYIIYTQGSNKEQVLNWIKKKDIFSRKYTVFPIVQGGHWSLMIFCHLGESLESKSRTPCILLLDSLEKAEHAVRLEPEIRKFVLDISRTLEWKEDTERLHRIPYLVPKVPQQRDGVECGFFVLYYIKLFVESAPESFSVSDGYPYFMKKDWFDPQSFDCFRETIYSSRN